MARTQARGWVAKTVQRYRANPGLTPRPARIARLMGSVQRNHVAQSELDQVTLLVYGALSVRGELPAALRNPDWDRELGLATPASA